MTKKKEEPNFIGKVSFFEALGQGAFVFSFFVLLGGILGFLSGDYLTPIQQLSPIALCATWIIGLVRSSF